jgi:hypothetical protein
MRQAVAAMLVAMALLSSGCVNVYSSVISEDCAAKYPSAGQQSECLLTKAQYFAAFGDDADAMGQCDAIKALIPKDFFSGLSKTIGLNHEVEMYNKCIDDTAKYSLNDAYCSMKITPGVFGSIANVIASVPFPFQDANSAEGLHVAACKEAVQFEKERQESLPKIMDNFLFLMTTPPKGFGG